MTDQPAPVVVARSDQARAHVNELVDRIREHHTHDDCPWPTVCLGRPVANTLYDTCPDRLEELLATALLQLANTNQKG
jgi:hypothetical protein